MKTVCCVLLIAGLASNASAEPMPNVRLIWGAEQNAWAAIEASGAEQRTRMPLAHLIGLCPPLASSKDAEISVADLDADGVGDLVMWSRSASYLMTWPRWQADRAAEFRVMRLRCADAGTRNEQVCWATSFLGHDARSDGLVITVLRDRRPHQSMRTDSPWPDGLTLLDVNQDGHGDLVVPWGGCTGNCRVEIWPYSVEQDRYVRSPTLANLANVRVSSAKRRLIESRVCRGQACAVFDARLLAVDGIDARVVGKATQADLSPGSLMKRLRVEDLDGRVVCDAVVDPSDGVQTVMAGDCDRWPLIDR